MTLLQRLDWQPQLYMDCARQTNFCMQATFLDPAQREWLHERQATALRAAINA